jgi:hypothetical protein
LEHFKAAYDNKAFTLSHCWYILKDCKKWEDSFSLWQELDNKKGRGNENASTGDVINVDAQGPAGSGLPGGVQQHRPPGHKASKADIVRQAGSLAFQETFKELMTRKEEVTTEREERQRRDKESTTKSFIDLQERSIAADEAETKTKALEAKVKARL